MCGRYTLTLDARTLADYFELDRLPSEVEPHYNIAPGQRVPIIRAAPGLGRHLDLVRWGLIPSWAEDARIGNRLINARAETVADKPAFRTALRRRRCLIPADGFYEWRREEDGKQPYWIGLEGRRPLAFAGLWEHWESADAHAVVESCTIITTGANAQLRPLHARMPVILASENYARWLDPEQHDVAALGPLLRPYDGPLHIYPVSREINSPLKDNPHLLQPLKEEI